MCHMEWASVCTHGHKRDKLKWARYITLDLKVYEQIITKWYILQHMIYFAKIIYIYIVWYPCATSFWFPIISAHLSTSSTWILMIIICVAKNTHQDTNNPISSYLLSSSYHNYHSGHSNYLSKLGLLSLWIIVVKQYIV